MNSKQRQVILEVLTSLSSHPTADEMFQLVRKKLPNISLGTVYRNLNYLATAGIIKQLVSVSGQKRFDARADNHYHFTCNCCGRVYDIEAVKFANITKFMRSLTDHHLEQYKLEFSGTCSHCQQKETRNGTTQ